MAFVEDTECGYCSDYITQTLLLQNIVIDINQLLKKYYSNKNVVKRRRWHKTMWATLSTVSIVLSVTSLHADIGTLTTVLSSDTDIKPPIVTNKNFVDVIKESLRRNNDDYKTNDHVGQREPAPRDTRRALNESDQVAAETKDDETEILPATPTGDTNEFRSAVKDVPRSKKKHEHVSIRSHSSHKVKFNSNTERKMVDRWKVLIEKSNRLRKYTSSPKIEPSSSAKVLRIQNAMRTKTEAKTTTETMTSRTTTRPRPRQAPNIAILPLRAPGPVRKPPNADQLDMAPARGAYIHDLRLKGRFCYRHILWPEGPKYNSKGETIMPAFNASMYNRKRKFFETVKPKFMLPRCCNCCKKSVLGCQ
ncbi:unnamed protein product [Arctia plantaginis]|uniref:Uncharacterized protein n=1 Tax=Arctia plantaginis TaxID=874455 RepID=A0A8S1ACD6_ARCPL|nr:unnamed protein product [Arctia plantaginis]CAB3247321.1 unnamed protein product [Arctia plantaginis]